MAPSAAAILSIGDMGVGIAKLLLAKGFTVTTNIAGRSEDTAARARAAGIQLVASDAELIAERIGKRRRGTTVEDLAEAVAEGLERKRKKQE